MVSCFTTRLMLILINSDDIVDGMFTYTCDVSNYKEVEEVAERIRKEVSFQFLTLIRC